MSYLKSLYLRLLCWHYAGKQAAEIAELEDQAKSAQDIGRYYYRKLKGVESED